MTQTKVGWRPYVATTTTTASTLLTSIYGVWNAEGSNNVTVKNAWNANGDAVDSKSGVNGTIAAPSGASWVPSTMTYGSGKLGSGAFTFNGNNFISLPNNSLNLVGDFTISLWAYIPSTSGVDLISTFDNSTGFSSYNGWNISCQSNTVNFYVYNAFGGYSNRYYGVSVPIPGINQWIHITVTKVVGQEANIYVNGVLGTKTITTNGGATSAMNPAYITRAYIGASYFFSRSPNAYNAAPNGLKLDAIQVWDGTALDQTAVTELYNSGNGQEYPFTTSNALIASPNDSVSTNHGTLMNGTTFTTGKIGKAFTFDGINDYVQLPDNSLNSLTGSFSVSAWFKTASSISNIDNFILSNISANAWFNNPNGFGLEQYGNVLSFNIYNNTNTYTELGANYFFSTNTWYHVVATKLVNGNMNLYLNGSLVGTKVTTVNPTYLATVSKPCIGALNIPARGSIGYFAQSGFAVDELNLWTKELTATEVTDLYNSGAGKQYPTF